MDKSIDNDKYISFHGLVTWIVDRRRERHAAAPRGMSAAYGRDRNDLTMVDHPGHGQQVGLVPVTPGKKIIRKYQPKTQFTRAI